MLRAMRRLAVLAWALFAACRCDPPVTKLEPGELAVVQPGGALGASLALDFGPVIVGGTKPLTVTLKNGGRTDLVVTSRVSAGDEVGAPGSTAPFSLELPASVPANGDASATITFHPQEERAFHATLELEAKDAKEGSRVVTIELTARGVNPRCTLPAELDFGRVAVGSYRELTLTLSNPLAVDVTARVERPSGVDATLFERRAPTGDDVPLPAGATSEVRVRYQPTEPRSAWAVLRVRVAASCDEQLVRLKGEGVLEQLKATPSPLDFGFAALTTTVRRTLTLENTTNEQLAVSLVFARADFSGPASVMVPPFATQAVELSFRPAVLGNRSSSVSLRAGFSVSVPLLGYGGGPDIDVRPATLAFGRVPFFQGSATSTSRRLTVTNMGTRSSTLAAENLFLGTPADGGVRGAPWAEVRTTDPNTDVTEFSVTLSSSPAYSPANGLEARAGSYVTLDVTLTPKSTGPRSASIAVFSSDPDEPEVVVPVTASVQAFPPCNLAVSPASLDFGVVTPPLRTVRGVTLENRGTQAQDICLVSDVHLAPSSDPLFSLPAGGVPEKELQPGERWTVEVAATPSTVPPSVTRVTGELAFSVSSPTPAAPVPLSASLAPACLTIAPIQLDFGGVQTGCNSAERQFVVYNVCASAVNVTDIRVIEGAGLSANTPPLCTGTAPCPEFSVTQRPTLPQSLGPGAAPLIFSVRYRPLDANADLGTIGVSYVAGAAREQLVTLRGQGTVAGVTTDVFRSTGVPKVDILFAIDGSCSMSSKQASLASNLPSFFAQALRTNVDYHLAVVVGQGPPSVATRGNFVFGPTHPNPVLMPNTPNVEQQFSNRVTSIGAQGGNEECFQPVLDALTPPLVTGSNAGFLRNDAQLAVVCVTDDSDYSPQPVTFYQSALLNLKGGRPTELSISAIAGYTQNCSATTLENGRYLQMTGATGGVREEICTQDWAQALRRLGQTAFGESGRFFLRSTPDLMARAIEVKVDGVVVPALGSRGEIVWEYDPVINAVRFNELYRPAAGSQVEITYQAACL